MSKCLRRRFTLGFLGFGSGMGSDSSLISNIKGKLVCTLLALPCLWKFDKSWLSRKKAEFKIKQRVEHLTVLLALVVSLVPLVVVLEGTVFFSFSDKIKMHVRCKYFGSYK